MNRTKNLAAAVVAAVTLAGLATVGGQAALKRTVLQQADISAAGREAIMTRTEIPTGAASGRHTHPGEEVSYVLEGTLTLEVDGKPPVTLKAGDVFLIPMKTIHNARNSTSATTTVVTTYIVEKGQPLATPVQ